MFFIYKNRKSKALEVPQHGIEMLSFQISPEEFTLRKRILVNYYPMILEIHKLSRNQKLWRYRQIWTVVININRQGIYPQVNHQQEIVLSEDLYSHLLISSFKHSFPHGSLTLIFGPLITFVVLTELTTLIIIEQYLYLEYYSRFKFVGIYLERSTEKKREMNLYLLRFWERDWSWVRIFTRFSLLKKLKTCDNKSRTQGIGPTMVLAEVKTLNNAFTPFTLSSLKYLKMLPREWTIMDNHFRWLQS